MHTVTTKPVLLTTIPRAPRVLELTYERHKKEEKERAGGQSHVNALYITQCVREQLFGALNTVTSLNAEQKVV